MSNAVEEFMTEELFKYATNPYGIPFIEFPSNDGEAMTFMAEGHLPKTNRLIATFNYILRKYAVALLVPRSEFLEWGYATFNQVDKTIYEISIKPGGSSEGFPVTFCEL